MIKRIIILVCTLLVLMVVFGVTFILFPTPEQPPLPVVTEVQSEPELLTHEVQKPTPLETLPLVTMTTLPVTTKEPSVTMTSPVTTTTAPPIITKEPPVTTTSSPPTTTTPPIIADTPGRDIEGNGYNFYRGPDGRLDFDYMIAPNGEVISYEEYGFRMKTDPPKPDGTQWIENGQHFKIVNEQMYVWHDILGWGKTGGVGTVTIMDAQSDGHRFYVEPDGRVNLGKVVTLAGDIISYEEYRQWKAAY